MRNLFSAIVSLPRSLLRIALYVFTFALAGGLSAWLTPKVREAAIRFGIVDRPDGKLKRHEEPVAYLGGLSIFLSFLLSLAFTVSFRQEVLGLLLAGCIVVLVGLVDDLGALHPWTKLAGQTVAVLVLTPDNRFGYVASVTNGDTDFNDVGGDYQATLKLWAQPFGFLYLSASGLYTSALDRINGALWLGEGWARPFGSGGPPINNWIDGASVPDDPDGIGQAWAVALDVVVTPVDGVRIWFSGGHYDVPSQSSGPYDRELWYGLGEIVLGGQLVTPGLEPLYVGVANDCLLDARRELVSLPDRSSASLREPPVPIGGRRKPTRVETAKKAISCGAWI